MRRLVLAAVLASTGAAGLAAQQKVTADLPATIAPSWVKGIQPINQENYWNAVACGKLGGQRPACVFYDADICKNPEFEISMFTPYKKVAYEVWQAVRARQEAPTPSYPEAQRTRIILKLTPKPATKNAVTGAQVRRDGKIVKPVSQSIDAGVGNFVFDFPAFAATGDATLEMIGAARGVSCALSQQVLSRMR